MAYSKTRSIGIAMSSSQTKKRHRTNGQSYYGKQDINGPMYAETYFGIDFDGGLNSEDAEGHYHYELEEDALTDFEPYQLEFDFKTQDEMERDLRSLISKYDQVIRRIGEYAVQWHSLMVDCEENQQIEKMFKDLQLYRKLSGRGAPSDRS